MVQQKLGRRAWEYSSACYCVGYCHNCKAKQVINSEQIATFNRATPYGDKLTVNRKINFWSGIWYWLKAMRHLRIAINVKGVDTGDDI